MSLEVLAAILGRDVVEKMTKDEINALAHELDSEILKDPDLAARLGKVVREAAERMGKAQKSS